MTIKEIAQLAGVSSAAVSRYLNGGYVSEEKKEQIRKVIEETGYQPSAQARMLRTKKASLVGVVVPKINSESISRITAGIESVLAERGYQMLLAGTDNTPAKEVEYLRLFENYPVDGIILVGTMFTAGHRKFLKETKVPVVVIGQRTSHLQTAFTTTITVQERQWDRPLPDSVKKELLTSALPAMTRRQVPQERTDLSQDSKMQVSRFSRKISEPQPSRWNPDMSLLWIFWKANVISMSYHVQPIP